MICERLSQVDIRKHRELAKTLFMEKSSFVRVVRTEARPFGGFRYWFLCPECARRCAILYIVPELRCRLCTGAHYKSEAFSPKDRRLHAAFKLRKKLGQSHGGIIAPFPQKPKWMRWHTYYRIKAKAVQNEQRIWREVWLEDVDKRY